MCLGSSLAAIGLGIAGLAVKFLDPPLIAPLYITIALNGLGLGMMNMGATAALEKFFDK